MASGPPAAADVKSKENRRRRVALAATLSMAGAAAALAAGLAFVGRTAAGPRRAFFDRLGPDGAAVLAELRSGSEWLQAAVAAAVAAVALAAFRRRVAGFLSSRPVPGGEAPPPTAAELASAAVVCAAGVALAMRNLDLPMRMDESQTVVEFASRSAWTALTAYASNNNHVLHSLLVWVAHKAGGWNPAALRAPAFAAACLTLPALWWFARREYGPLAAAFATSLFATSPMFVEYASNARGYSLMGLLWTLSLCVGRVLVRRPDRVLLWILYAVLLALGHLTIPVMVFPAAVAAAWMLLVRWRSGDGVRPFAVRLLGWSGGAAALAAALYAPAVVASGGDVAFVEMAAAGGSWLDGQWVWTWARRSVLGVWPYWHAATPAWALVAVFALAVAGLAAPRQPSGHRGVFPLAVFAGVAAVLLVKPVVLGPRMTLFQLQAATIASGAGAALLLESALAGMGWRGRRRGRAARAAAVLSMLACGMWWATRPGTAEWFAAETGYSPGAPALFAEASRLARTGDVVVACRPTGPFYLAAAGRPVRTEAAGLGLPPWCRAYAVGPEGRATERIGEAAQVYVVVDDVAYRASRDPADLVWSSRDMEEALAAAGHQYEVAARSSLGVVYRLER